MVATIIVRTTNIECPDGSGPSRSTARSCQGPSGNVVDSTAQVNLGVQPVDIHSKICRTSLLPYRYWATIPCFSNSALFLQFLSVPHLLRILFGVLACLAVRYGYLLGLAVRSHTVPLQLVHKPCISQIKWL